MDKTKIEYLCVVAATWFHGMLTAFSLGSMPRIAIQNLLVGESIAVGVFILWTLYGMSLYLVIKFCQNGFKNVSLQIVTSIFFGIFTALMKSGFDFVEDKVTYGATMKAIAIIDEVDTIVFGMLLMVVLHLIVARKRIYFDWKKVSWSLGFFVGTIAVYSFIVCRMFIDNQKAIEMYSATAEEIQNLDFHFAFKILSVNPVIYVVAYIFFWWFMNRATIRKVKSDTIVEDKED